MKYTLLEMVQDILSSMNSDEVNSITDTTESLQVSRVIRSCYFEIVNDNMPEHTTMFQLEPSGDADKPVLMYRPSDVHNLQLIKYNVIQSTETDPNFTTMTPLGVEDFFRRTDALRISDSTTSSMSHTIGTDEFTFLFRNDKAPTYYTSFDDSTFIFDSYDSSVDTTLQKSKTRCIGEKEQTFELVDTYSIELDEQQHIWLLNEAKSLAFQEILEMTNQKAEKSALRQKIKAQRQKFVNNDFKVYYNSLPIYGRSNRIATVPVIMH